MRDLRITNINGYLALICDDHGVIASFNSLCRFSDLVAAEQDHATQHVIELHKEVR